MTKKIEALLMFTKLISPASSDEELREILNSHETPWNDIIDYANLHLLVPVLHSALQHRGLLPLIQDELIVEYLATVYEYNRIRNELIIRQLQDISDLLSEIGVSPVLLKGSAALSEGYYHSIGARVMADIDILVPENKVMQCIELLETKGKYKAVDSETPEWDSPQHYRKIYSDDGIAALEVHRYSIAHPDSYLPNALLMQHVKPSKIIKNAYVLEPTFDVYHVFLHSEIQDSCHKKHTLSLRGLHHAAMIVAADQNEIDWEQLKNLADQHEVSTVWSDYLYEQKNLFGTAFPPEMVGRSKHFQGVVKSIEESGTSKSLVSIFVFDLKELFSYKLLKERYNFKTIAGYPLAFTKNLFNILVKYAFTAESRKNLFKNYRSRMRLRKHGQ